MSIRRCAITVSDAGEFGLIARVRALLPQGTNVVVGPGDDAAVVAAPDRRVVVTTDALVEGQHFRRDWSSGRDVGHKAAAQSLADVMAMGATPTAVVVALVAPADLELAWTDGLTEGLRAECDRAGASVVGGDVAAGPLVVVTVTALGDLTGVAPVLRGGARPGDRIVSSGGHGASAAGLRALRAGRLGEPYVEAHRRPRPPYPLGPLLARAGATALIDTSDGLVADLRHIAEASGVDAELDLAGVMAVAAAGVTDVDALTGGEDHALVGALPSGAELPRGINVIGSFVEPRAAIGQVRVDGRPMSETGGWEHFR